MRQERILKLSEIFGVSPSYIIGFEEADAIDFESLSQEERFVRLYNRLDAYKKSLVDNMLEVLSKEE